MYVSLSALTSGFFGRQAGFVPAPRVIVGNGGSTPGASGDHSASSDAQAVADQKGLQHVRSQVDRQLGNAAPDKAAAGTYSGSDVVSHVLDSVARRLQQSVAAGEGADQLGRLLDQARRGVAQGFQQARDALQSTGRLSDSLDSSIQDSLSQINKGLDALSRQYLGGQPSVTAPGQSSAGADVVGGSQISGTRQGASVEYASREALNLSIRTADGDRVRIRLSERQYLGAAASFQSDASGSQARYSRTTLFSGRYQIAVQGSLSPQEQKAVGDLIGKVQTVASRFFGGDVQGAFKQASRLGLDGSQLARFSLSLSSVQSVRASAYSSNQVPDAGTGSISSPNPTLQPVGDLAASVKQAQGQARHVGLDATALHNLFSHFLDQGGHAHGHPAASHHRQSVDAFLKSLLESFGHTVAPSGKRADRTSPPVSSPS